MNKVTDYREAKLNEIMNSTELLEFEYKTKQSNFKIILKLIAILIVSVAIFTSLPLLPNTGKGYTAAGASTVNTIDSYSTQIADFDI